MAKRLLDPTRPRANVLTLDTGRQYIIRNNTDKPLTLPNGRTPLLRYARIEYECNPGEEVIVPFDIITTYFGDPRSRPGILQQAEDSRGKHTIPPRGNELQRLAVFYGLYEHGLEALPDVVPDVTITTLDGKEIIPPCFDLEGDFYYGFSKDQTHARDSYLTRIEELEQEMAEMRQRANAAEEQPDDSELLEDRPSTLH